MQGAGRIPRRKRIPHRPLPRDGGQFRSHIEVEHAAHPLPPVALTAENDAAPALVSRTRDSASVEYGCHPDRFVAMSPAHALNAFIENVALDRCEYESPCADFFPVSVFVLD